MPERFEIYIVYERRYINTLPFLFCPLYPQTVTERPCGYVSVAPQIAMPNRRIGQQRGRETILECAITAFPHAVNYWEKDGRRITSSMKHRIEAYDEGDHTLTLSLRISAINDGDFGEYRCIASNSLGHDEGSMVLYGTTDRTVGDGGTTVRPSSTVDVKEFFAFLRWPRLVQSVM